MKTALKPVPKVVEETDPLEQMSLRVKGIADKLCSYIQRNGCSDKLKRKARHVMAEISK